MIKYAFFLFAAAAMADTAPVVDENLRLGALQTIFPGMRISLNATAEAHRRFLAGDPATARTQRSGRTSRHENIYRVIGNATNEAEKQASTQISDRLKAVQHPACPLPAVPWPGRISFIAVLQYNFEDAIPPEIGLAPRSDSCCNSRTCLEAGRCATAIYSKPRITFLFRPSE